MGHSGSGSLPEWLAKELAETPIGIRSPPPSPPPPLSPDFLFGGGDRGGPGISPLFFDHTQEAPKQIGKGSFGNAMLLQDKTSVVKYMDIQTVELRNVFHREVYALLLLGSHPNIAALKGWREDILQNEQGEKYGYLEIEYALGKTVHEWLTDHKSDPDSNLRLLWYPFVQTLLLTIEYIHSNGVHHLDLHPKNVMVNIRDDNKNTLKVIDFGMSCSRNPEFPGNETCGSPGMVPYYTGFVSSKKMLDSRLLQPEDMRLMDLWSVGALAHLWWFSDPPYAQGRKPDHAAARNAWLLL